MSKMPTVFVSADLAKSHINSYTRKDGTVVQAHDDNRVAKPKASGTAGHNMAEFDKDWHSNAKSWGGEHKAAFAYGWMDANNEHKGHTGGDLPTSKHLGNLKDHYEAGKKAAKIQAGRMGDADVGLPEAMDHHIANYKPKAGGGAKSGAAQAKPTGSMALAKMTNAGTAKWPMHVKTSEKMGKKHADGSTHHVGGFEAPTHGKGDHLIHHDGKLYSATSKEGKNLKTGEKSYEYSAGDNGEHRAWVSHSGHLQND